MRHPWYALTQLLIEGTGEEDIHEAWTETASRLGLVRLGWWSQADASEPDLAFPGDRALVRTADRRWRVQAAPGAGSPGFIQARPSHCRGEDEVALSIGGTLLVAAAQPGRLPATEALSEVASLALAVWNQRSLLRERAGAQLRLAQARATAAAGHDLRNELTRALLFAGRGQAGDQEEVIGALGAARELAHAALLTPDSPGLRPRLKDGQLPWQAFDLRTSVTEEVRAAAAAVRAPEGRAPSVRLKCPKGLWAFTDERMFRRALRNVVLNAMEASVRKAELGEPVQAVTVLVERLPEATASGYAARLKVSDTGTGMEASEVQRFLEPRTQASVGHGNPRGSCEALSPLESTGLEATGLESTGLESTGLGTASLALALAEGALPLRVESRPGRGTDVTLWLRTVREPETSPRFVVDPDPRRARRTVIRQRASGGDDVVWAVLDPRAAPG